MPQYRNAHLDAAERSYGIHFEYNDQLDFLPDGVEKNFNLAMDAQSTLITTSSSGIPAWLTTTISPKLIQVLVTPNKAAQIAGEMKQGDWTTLTIAFPMVEHAGEVSSYGDWNNNGSVSANVNFPQRQSYHYQTITQWGERQLAIAGVAKIDWAQRLDIASAMVLDKFQNNSYFYGISGLQNYGLLNDPYLPAAIQPGAKAYNTAAHGPWFTAGAITATANEIFADVTSLYNQLITQSGGLIDKDTPMVLACSPSLSLAFTATNQFNVNVYDLLKKNFGNIRFETALQYATNAGQMMQLMATSVDGQDTMTTAFTEKMRAHAIVKDLSSFKQKKSQGTWGTIIYYPFAVASMLGL